MAIATTAEKNSLATKYGQDAAFAALFISDPGTTGSVSGEVTGGTPAYARKALTWGAPSAGVVTATATFDVPTGTTLTHAGLCSASTGANLIDRVAITNQTFTSQGTYLLTLTYTQS